jgi:protein-arginine kinase activator protein McsA
MTKKEMNELADLIVEKLLTTYIKEQQIWYTTNTFKDTVDQMFRKRSRTKEDSEVELVGELAKLMTQMNMHMDNEEYEKCAELKKKIDIINKKLGNK